MALRKGPWTVEEDFTLINYIALNGEGRWNSLAHCSGLRRTGKSCRLRWLNYLRPDVRRGNITLEEQLLILELHSRWGNRWSKIAQHLPGRTDNEIKNYWRTRVQKHAKQLKCDVNSKQFKDTLRYLWMPRLVERIQAAKILSNSCNEVAQQPGPNTNINELEPFQPANNNNNNNNNSNLSTSFETENSNVAASSENSLGTHVSPLSDLSDCCYDYPVIQISSINPDYYQVNHSNQLCYEDFQAMDQENIQLWMESEDIFENLWNINEDMWSLEKQD